MMLKFCAGWPKTAAIWMTSRPRCNGFSTTNWMGGGDHRGSIWLFADAQRGLVGEAIEAISRRMAHRWFAGGAPSGGAPSGGASDDELCVRANHFLLPEMLPFCLEAEANRMRRLD